MIESAREYASNFTFILGYQNGIGDVMNWIIEHQQLFGMKEFTVLYDAFKQHNDASNQMLKDSVEKNEPMKLTEFKGGSDD